MTGDFLKTVFRCLLIFFLVKHLYDQIKGLIVLGIIKHNYSAPKHQNIDHLNHAERNY